jgi:hypothetical protein
MQAERGEAMQIVCPKCEQVLGSAESTARLILTVHCPFDGHEFGVAVVPPEQMSVAKEILGPEPVAGT